MKVIKKRSRMAIVILMMFAVICVSAGCGVLGGGEPYAVMLNDVEILPGKTTVQELYDQGYGLTDGMGMFKILEDGSRAVVYGKAYDIATETEGNTIYLDITLLKDEKKVGSVTLFNGNSQNAPLSECVIKAIEIDKDDADTDQVSLLGIPFDEMSAEAFTEIEGEPKQQNGNPYTWSRGKYYFTLKYAEDGTFEGFSSHYNTY